MALKLKKNIDLARWDDFLANFTGFNPFSQSSSWGDILISEDKEVDKLAIFEGNEQIAAVLLIYEKLPFGFKYAFSPKGPVVKMTNDQFPMTNVIELILNYLKENKCVFWRVEPNVNLEIKDSNLKLEKVRDTNPSSTLLLDLEKSYEEILSEMHTKTRYNISLSKKKDLLIEEKKDLDVFWELMNKTGKRDAFRLHHKKHYEKILSSNLSSQVIIFFENKPIATGVFINFGKTFTYLYGASDYEYRQLMAPYLVQDFGLNKAKNEGCKYYDFFGIAPIKKDETGDNIYDENHQYAGVTRFKLGFGGKYFSAPGTFEISLNYKVYKIIKFIKAVKSLFKK